MTILYILVWAVLLALTIGLAQKNNRSVLVWTFVGLVFSPLLSLIILLVLGKKYDQYR